MPVELLLASRKCSECLCSPSRIVPKRKASGIIRRCRDDGTHFVCHKGTLAGVNLHCRGVHDMQGSTAHHLALCLQVPVREIDPDSLDPDASDWS